PELPLRAHSPALGSCSAAEAYGRWCARVRPPDAGRCPPIHARVFRDRSRMATWLQSAPKRPSELVRLKWLETRTEEPSGRSRHSASLRSTQCGARPGCPICPPSRGNPFREWSTRPLETVSPVESISSLESSDFSQSDFGSLRFVYESARGATLSYPLRHAFR